MYELGVLSGSSVALNIQEPLDPAQPETWQSLLHQYPGWQCLTDTICQRFSNTNHGDYQQWWQAIESLPPASDVQTTCNGRVTLGGDLGSAQLDHLEKALHELHPWRKGPFDLFGVVIDTEWRSDFKWQRLQPHLKNLEGARVLDVGSGNGYFGWQLLDAGAKQVVGIDPTLVFCMQHLAINRYANSTQNWVLPLRFEELPCETFDTVLSMGVVYHRKEPMQHIHQLTACLEPGGQLVIETLVVRGAGDLHPEGRYARMGNVHVIPCIDTLTQWLQQAGLAEVELVDVTPTTIEEQRVTDWMQFESLAHSLDPENSALTIEGHPAPVRAICTGFKKENTS